MKNHSEKCGVNKTSIASLKMKEVYDPHKLVCDTKKESCDAPESSISAYQQSALL